MMVKTLYKTSFVCHVVAYLVNFFKMKYSKRIKNLRLALSVTQREIADMFGVSPGAVAHWEADDRQLSGPVLKLLEIFEKRLQNIGKKSKNDKD